MSEEYELKATVKVESKQAEKDLENVAKEAEKTEESLKKVEKGAGQTSSGLQKMGDDGSEAAGKLGGALKSLARSFGLVLSAAAVVGFIKKVIDSNRALSQMSSRTGQASKNLRALQNQFKSLGYSADQANSLIEGAASSFANFKYNGQLEGYAKAFAMFGLSIMDAQGKMRDTGDLLIDAGERAMRMTGDRTSAQQLMMARGFSAADADLATRSDARERLKQMREEAAASAKAAEVSEKLNNAITRLQEKFASLVLKIDENTGLFEKMANGLDMVVPVAEGFIAILSEIGSALKSVFNVAKEALEPVIQLLDDIGNSVDKAEKEGKTPWWASWLTKGAEDTAGADYSIPEGMQNGTAPAGDIRERIKQNIMEREGVRLKAYKDSGGKWTIGYGHTKGVTEGMTITREEAARLLEEDMKDHVDPTLKLYANYSDKTKMLAADLAYNAGVGHVQKGTRFSKLAAAGDISRSDYAKLFVTAQGKYVRGLENRRNATYDAASFRAKRPEPNSASRQTQQVAGNTVNNNITINAKDADAGSIKVAVVDGLGFAGFSGAGYQPYTVA
nr:MAG TPA: tail tape measure [Caudoviricetes sp.]